MGIRCLALSCVTNAAAGVLPEPIDHERVLEVGARAAGDLVALVREVLPALGGS
jgi:purine-nucleoside phosphorylase